MRVGFLLNHDQAHQAAHAIPVAVSLARLRPDVEVVVATTSDILSAEAARLAGRLDSSLPIACLISGGGGRRLVSALDRLVPARRWATYSHNLPFFRTLDGLVVTEKTSLALKTRHRLNDLPIIHARHGAGDRAIGFNRQSAAFDHVLASGTKVRDRLIAEAGVRPERISVVGYSKFDLPRAPAPDLPFAHPDRPTVLYNPHPSPRLSSWFRHGRAILDFFVRSDRYNLIFAPHVMLFQRPLALSLEPLAIARVGRVPRRVLVADNIHVDLGSPRSVDMTYSDAADIYLGDVSSQAYEFLRRPRPCVFVNSHAVDARDDPSFAMWRAGPAIGDPALLAAALDEACRRQPHYAPIQREMLARTFDLTAEPSSERAARAIIRFLEHRREGKTRSAEAMPGSS